MASLLKRSALVAATVAGLTLALASPAAAHVTVNPNTATVGGYTKVTFRVPNENDKNDTTKLEVHFPTDNPVASVSTRPVPGWTAVAEKAKLTTPIMAHGTQITEAVSTITWTAQAGSAIKPGQFQEFDVSLGPLPASGQMIFKALQTYSDGTVVRWIDEPGTSGTEPEHPAPVLRLTPAGAPAAAPAAPAAAPAPPAVVTSGEKSSGTSPIGVIALIAGILAVVLAALALARTGRRQTGSAAADPADVPATAGRP